MLPEAAAASLAAKPRTAVLIGRSAQRPPPDGSGRPVMNLRELRTAGEELLSAIDGRPSSGLRRLPCSLVLRESSRPRQAQGQPTGYAARA